MKDPQTGINGINDPATQERILRHLLDNRPEKLKRRSAQECRRDEALGSRLITVEMREFLMAYGRTVPVDTPPLAKAEDQLRSLGEGPYAGDHAAAIEAHAVLARALLREGLIAEARSTLSDARTRLGQLRGAPRDEWEHLDGLLRQLASQAKMALGRFPAFPWILEDIHDEIAVPDEDWPHMILWLCWIAYRFGADREAMTMAHKLRGVMAQSALDMDALIDLWTDTRKLVMAASEDYGRSYQQETERHP